MIGHPLPAAELLRRDGSVVGLALRGQAEGGHVDVMAVMRVSGGGLEGLRGCVALAADLADALCDGISAKRSNVAFEAVMGFAAPGRHYGTQARKALSTFAKANGLHGIGLGHEVAPLLADFVRSLPGRVVALFASPVHGLPLTQRMWAAVEGPRADGDTALARCLEARPLLARLVVQAHDERPGSFDAAVSGPGGLDGALADQATRWKSVPRRLLGTLADAEACLLPYGAQSLAGLRGVVPGIRHDDDIPVRFALLLRSVPAAWHPRGEEEWEAFVDLLPVMEAVVDVAEPFRERDGAERAAASMLAAGHGWRALRARFAKAVGTLHLAHAVNDIDDFVSAFEAQVVTPALALSGLNPGAALLNVDMAAVAAATGILLSGRSVVSAVERSVAWHRRRPGMEAAMAALPGRVVRHASWPAGLPDATMGAFRIAVLTSTAALADEGRAGPDADGVHGMGHCVAQYAGDCLSGRSRILSMSTVGPDGAVVRASTVEVGIRDDDYVIVQHRGSRNEPVPEAARETLYDYLGEVVEGRLPVDRAAFLPLPAPGVGNVLERDSGYEWRIPGHWEAAFGQWAPFLRKGVRGMDLAAFAALAHSLSHGALADLTRSPWRPDAVPLPTVPPSDTSLGVAA